MCIVLTQLFVCIAIKETVREGHASVFIVLHQHLIPILITFDDASPDRTEATNTSTLPTRLATAVAALIDAITPSSTAVVISLNATFLYFRLSLFEPIPLAFRKVELKKMIKKHNRNTHARTHAHKTAAPFYFFFFLRMCAGLAFYLAAHKTMLSSSRTGSRVLPFMMTAVEITVPTSAIAASSISSLVVGSAKLM